MSNRYVLLKETPDGDIGDVYKKAGTPSDGHWYISEKNSTYHESVVEDNPEWFELIPDNNDVVIHPNYSPCLNGRVMYNFSFNKTIPENKFTKIKSAIEKVLNN